MQYYASSFVRWSVRIRPQAEQNETPFLMLAKTRRKGGKAWYGEHGGMVAGGATVRSVLVLGDRVRVAGGGKGREGGKVGRW